MSKWTLTVQQEFAAAHRLLGYEGKCADLHGHQWRVLLSVSSYKIDKLGMVVDFALIKNTLNLFLDSQLDHSCVLNSEDPLVCLLREGRQQVFTVFGENPTAECLAKMIYREVGSRLWNSCKVKVESVTVYESEKAWCKYEE